MAVKMLKHQKIPLNQIPCCRAAGYLTLAAVAKCLQAATWLVARGNKHLPLLGGLGEKGKKARQKLEVCGYEMVSDEVFRKISDTQAPQGILCIVRQCHYSLEEVLREKECPLLLVLENLQDPGNLGTILRAGEGAGVCGVVMSRDIGIFT